MGEGAELVVEPLGAAPRLADWLEALSHGSPFESRQAPAVWGGAVPRLTLAPILISLLKDPDRDVRLRVVAALGNLGGQAHWVLAALRAALKETALTDCDEAVRNQAVRAVLQAGPQPASEVSALIDSLQDELDVVRFHAAIALGDLGREARPAAAALIHAALWDEEPAVRVEAAMALWKIDRRIRPVIHALTNALGNDNELICWIAAEHLGQMGPDAREAVPALQQALRREFKMTIVRTGIALALERIDPQAAATGGTDSRQSDQT